MPFFFSILFLAITGVLFAHLARRYSGSETTNRRWIVILIANGLLGGLISDPEAIAGGWPGAFLLSAVVFVVSARVFGRVSWRMSMLFFGLYLVLLIVMIILLAILFGPEVLG